ncbi:response regulator transcription factor [Hephaestia mangrovi]|uniref:response regulator transcription factor n=1 Tax=Hephaestia mangrovi TaxID=2873268 RepID=UPI001CA60F79|nr:response regulator transcription factor [Hephaestia mangrovi]MBY8828513.1 response regulator transcription factor [Hephaestia mangrovi]
MNLNILLVEDDAALADLLATQLSEFGNTVTVAGDGQAAMAMLSANPFDAIILDRMLPRLDGMVVIEALRKQGITMPTLMLTALGQTMDKVEGLTAGADDYVVKPADPAEIEARLQALIRARRFPAGASDTVRVGDIVISPTKFRAWRHDRDLDLPRTEFKLLLVLARNAGAVMTRPMLIEQVWQYDFEPTTNIVDAYVRRLRVKMTQFGDDDLIVTARGVGYMLKAD